MLLEFIADSKSLAIVSHTTPDLDTLCAASSIQDIIPNIESFLVCKDMIPQRMQKLFPNQKWRLEIPAHVKEIIAIDCSNWQRTGLPENSSYKILNFDHHQTNTSFGEFNYIIKSASSTCEMLADIIRIYGIKIQTHTSQKLLNGIYDDTKCLQTPSTTSKTLKACKFLQQHGANPQIASQTTKPKLNYRKLKNLGSTLQNTYVNQHGIAICKQKGDHKRDHLDLIIDLVDQIPSKKFSALFTRNHKGLVRASLRNNKTEYDMTQIAKTFGGGGHKRAAGFIASKETIDQQQLFN